jgi:hypothetical protein
MTLAVVVASLAVLGAPPAGGEEVRVTVVAILASSDPKNAKVDPRLEEIAREIKKMEPALKGFSLATTSSREVAVGVKEKFELVDDQNATVTVILIKDKDERVRLKIKPPGVREITYRCCCGKYLPIITGYQTRDTRERLIIGVMTSPCK